MDRAAIGPIATGQEKSELTVDPDQSGKTECVEAGAAIVVAANNSGGVDDNGMIQK